MIKGYLFKEVEYPGPGSRRTILVKDIVDGHQTNAEVQGLTYVFEDIPEIVYFRFSLGSAFERESTTVYLEGPNLEILRERLGAINLFKGRIVDPC